VACTKTTTRPAPITGWTQQGVQGASLSNPGILQFIKHDSTNWMGKNIEVIAGTAVAWDAALKRYARTFTPSATTQGQGWLPIDLEPKVILDPIFPPTGIIVTFQDVVKAVFSGPFNTQQGQVFFGMGHNTEITNALNPWGKIGFRCYYAGAGVQPTWVAYFNSLDGLALFKVDTGIKVDSPRHLKVELDGALQQIRWWIDGTLVASLSPAAGTVPGESGLNQNSFADPASNMTLLWYAYGGADGAAFVTIQYQMSGLPTITEQFSDI
jgi:hypothetical protein